MNSPGFLILIVAFGFLWFVLIRPQKRRQVEAARMLSSVEVGSQVLTAGGIYGEVTELHDDDVMVRIAPELEVRVARKAIGAVIPPAQPDAEPDAEPDLEPDGAPPPEHDG
ncbi:MAG: preprotein translocase subunit YajC [Gaiellaceae bacterium]|nr:preprotein translocase subunit YajC [Gaiellaceae bacterium]MDX6469006.1 preprotein translocase subunit YajC [Gaiellaceae bacterium]